MIITDQAEKIIMDIGAIISGILPLFFASIPHVTSIFGLIWLILRVYDYIKYDRPKKVRDSNNDK